MTSCTNINCCISIYLSYEIIFHTLYKSLETIQQSNPDQLGFLRESLKASGNLKAFCMVRNSVSGWASCCTLSEQGGIITGMSLRVSLADHRSQEKDHRQLRQARSLGEVLAITDHYWSLQTLLISEMTLMVSFFEVLSKYAQHVISLSYWETFMS